MTQKNSSPNSSNKQPYSVGTLLVTILLVGAYWWLTGSLPGNNTASGTPIANLPVSTTTSEEVIVGRSSDGATPVTAATAEAPVTEAPATETPNAVATETVAAKNSATTPPTATVAAPPSATSTAIPTATATARPQSTATPRPKATATNPPRAGPRGMAVMALDELPPEAAETVDLILQGGPFPFDRDGITFQNREGLLPRQARGYYSEYTVVTPGSRDRGARRIIAGAEGEFYYTDDHYASFVWVEVP